MHIAQKFERLLEAYRHPDGRKWSGQDLSDATGGIVTRSYVTNLRKGRIENPGFDKLRAIAKAMNFPPELWFEEGRNLDRGLSVESAQELRGISARTNWLFEIIKDENTGQPYTTSEVARMSLGNLTEEQIEEIRTGKLTNPSFDQVLALADAFGVHPAYFLDIGGKSPITNEEAMNIFRDETVSAIARKSLHLPGRERQMILGIIQQFEDMHEAEDRDTTP